MTRPDTTSARRDERGYALLELAVAVAIIGALLAGGYAVAHWLTDGAVPVEKVPSPVGPSLSLLGLLLVLVGRRGRRRTDDAPAGDAS